jgi:hypothetical protein
VTTHVKVLGWLFIVFGVFYVMLAFGSSMVMGILASFVASQGDPDAAIGATVLGLTGGAFFIFWLCVGIPGILAGWGLLNYKPWARILAIVLSAIRLINIPIGTVLGVYGLWVLFNKETETLFARSGPMGQ